MRTDGQGYLAEPNKDGEIVRWRGASHGDKIAMKKFRRRMDAQEPIGNPAEITFAKVRASRTLRGQRITQHNAGCTKMERKAKDGKLLKDGVLNLVKGAFHPPFTLKLGRVPNEGYTGAELRAIRGEKGCGRPLRKGPVHA